MNDEDVIEAMAYCKQLNCTVHVRGTDASPIIELRHKGWSRKIIGGIELKQMFRRINARGTR